MSDGSRSLAIVVPVYNEEAGLARFHQELTAVLDALEWNSSIWYVDDGSSDGTLPILIGLSLRDRRVRAIELSRNFGHQAALLAGLETAEADVVITLDGDGQHPPSLIPQLLDQYGNGADVVQALRRENANIGFWKRMSARYFYWLVNRLTEIRLAPGSADFRLLSRPAVEALRAMPERHEFLRGMVGWLGFRQAKVEYEPERRIAGTTKFSVGRMARLALHALFSFSQSPLRLCYTLGAMMLLLCLAEGLYTVFLYFSPNRSQLVPGWSSLMFFLLLGNALQLLTLGVVAHYVGYIFDEAKRRPRFVIRRLHGGTP